MISVRDLTKVYTVPIKQPGLWGSLRSLVDRTTRDVVAVDGITFEVPEGQRVGFLGPNGAGKTTTLKMLTGLLHPTAGTCEVLGYRPKERATDFLRQVTLVMGQKQQLLWDLPPRETFALNRAVYGLTRTAWSDALDELVDLLDLAEVIDRPTRNLSLGQRMRAELCAALLHRPRVLFLDEPTIGLDVEVQALVRRFVRTYADRHGATVVLTSHDMADVAAIVDRVLLIGGGRLGFDGTLPTLSQTFGEGRRLEVRGADTDLGGIGLSRDDAGTWFVSGTAEAVNRALSAVLQAAPNADVTVTDPPLEEVLRRAFRAQGQAETPS